MKGWELKKFNQSEIQVLQFLSLEIIESNDNRARNETLENLQQFNGVGHDKLPKKNTDCF